MKVICGAWICEEEWKTPIGAKKLMVQGVDTRIREIYDILGTQ